jgi:hypothetical protein
MAEFQGHVVLHPQAVNELLRGETGPVVRYLFVAGEIVRQEAKRLVGYSQPDPVPRRKPRSGPHLRDTIVKRLVSTSSGPTMQVGSESKVALWHHEGTQAHTIVPRRAARLVFYSPRAGRVIFAKIVHHPGTKPNRFLTNALRALRGRY